LNDIVAQLWPHINVAGSKMLKDIVEPMFASMLPGPLSSLHFTKIDLGHVPLSLSNVLATKTETESIKLLVSRDTSFHPSRSRDQPGNKSKLTPLLKAI